MRQKFYFFEFANELELALKNWSKNSEYNKVIKQKINLKTIIIVWQIFYYYYYHLLQQYYNDNLLYCIKHTLLNKK